MRLRSVLLFICCCATTLPAQTVRGSVTDPARMAPVAGTLVILEDSTGRDVGRAITAADGSFRLTARAPGLHRVRALRIGYRPALSLPVRLRTGDVVELPPLASGAAIVLDTVRVSGRSECRVDDAIASTIFNAWDQARSALGAADIAGAGSGNLSIATVGYVRTLDARSGRVLEQIVTPVTARTHRPWASASPSQLRERGYVTQGDDGWLTYHAPGLDALGSDDFVRDHCFRFLRSDDAEGLLGIDFEPSRARRDVGELRGTAWLDATTHELRRLEFRYVNAPVEHEDANAGGVMHFARLPGGAFVVSRWDVRLPVVEVRNVPTSGFNSRGTYREATVRQVRVTGGEVTHVLAGADTVWRGAPRVFAGVVRDSATERPVRGAIVSLRGTSINARTDDRGRFRAEGALPGAYLADVRTDSLALLGVVVAVPVTVSSAAEALNLRIPGAKTLAARACTMPGAVVAGRVADSAGTAVAAAMTLEWVAPRSDSTLMARDRNRWLTTQADARGHFHLCGVPASVALTLRAESPVGASVRELSVSADAGLALLDVIVKPNVVADGALTGTVMADVNGAPMPDVEVTVPALERRSWTDERGRFRMTLPPGTHTVSVRRVGFAPVDREVTVPAGRTINEPILMGRVALVDAVEVTARRTMLDCYEHKRLGFGTHLERADLQKFDGLMLSSALQQVLGLKVERGRGSYAWVAGDRPRRSIMVRQPIRVVDMLDSARGAGGACYSQVYLDHVRVYRGRVVDPRRPEPLFDINLIPVESVEAIEFYSSEMQVPERYADADQCGVLVIHTRPYEPKKTARDTTRSPT